MSSLIDLHEGYLIDFRDEEQFKPLHKEFRLLELFLLNQGDEVGFGFNCEFSNLSFLSKPLTDSRIKIESQRAQFECYAINSISEFGSVLLDYEKLTINSLLRKHAIVDFYSSSLPFTPVDLVGTGMVINRAGAAISLMDLTGVMEDLRLSLCGEGSGPDWNKMRVLPLEQIDEEDIDFIEFDDEKYQIESISSGYLLINPLYEVTVDNFKGALSGLTRISNSLLDVLSTKYQISVDPIRV